MRLAVAALAVLGCGETKVVWPDTPAVWPDPTDYPGPTGGRLYLTNSGDDTVSVLDMETLAELDRVPVGLVPVEKEGPHHLAISPDGEWAFIGISNFVPGSGSGPHGVHGGGDADGYCLKMSLADHRIVAEARVDRNPGDVRMLPDGTVLQSHFDLRALQEALAEDKPVEEGYSRLAIIDGSTMQIRHRPEVCAAPHGIATATDGGAVYLACYGSDEVGIVDLTGGEPTVSRVPLGDDARVGVPAYGPYAVAVSPADGSVWLSCWMDDSVPDQLGEVRVFDPESGEMDESRVTRQLGNPMFGTFSRDGARFYAPYQISDVVAIVDTETMDEIESVALDRDACLNVHALALSPDESSLYAVCEGDRRGPGTLLELDPATLEMRRFVEVGVFPDDVAILVLPE